MNKSAHFIAVAGMASQVLIPAGFGVSLLRLHSAVSEVNLNQTTDVQQITAFIGTATSEMGSAFEPLLWAFGFAMAGLMLFIVAITRFRYRRRWAFWFSCIYGACLPCLFPLGLPFGLFLLIYALIHRHEFVSTNSAPAMTLA